MAVRNDPMNQRGPKPGTNVARTKEPCPGCGQKQKASSTPAPVVTPEQFTQDQGAGLWARACTAVGAHLRMLGTYAMADGGTAVRQTVRTYEREKKDSKKDQQSKSGSNVVATFVSTGPDHFAHARTYAEIALPLVAARETNQDIKSFL